jgi:hypothetical protein
MALFIKQNDTRSQLQERLAAELQEKARRNAAKVDMPDGVSDSQYVKDTKQTTSLAWLWIIISIVMISLVIWLVVQSIASS